VPYWGLLRCPGRNLRGGRPSPVGSATSTGFHALTLQFCTRTAAKRQLPPEASPAPVERPQGWREAAEGLGHDRKAGAGRWGPENGGRPGEATRKRGRSYPKAGQNAPPRASRAAPGNGTSGIRMKKTRAFDWR
jgi:hypothetical protein